MRDAEGLEFRGMRGHMGFQKVCVYTYIYI